MQLNEPPDLVNTEEWHKFKREIYQQTLAIIFAEMKKISVHGEVTRCGDGKARIIFPAVPIHSMDLEETWVFTGCRSLNAKFPCPRCLVSNSEQHDYDVHPPLRTSLAMKEIYQQAQAAKTKAEAHQLLMGHGLNDVKVCLFQSVVKF
jgi:hypothetical protein